MTSAQQVTFQSLQRVLELAKYGRFVHPMNEGQLSEGGSQLVTLEEQGVALAHFLIEPGGCLAELAIGVIKR